MELDFRTYAARRLSSASMNSYMSGLRSIEAVYGDLDALYADDRLEAVFADLAYSSADERAGRPNPSRVPINRNLARQLSNLRSHLRFYVSYKDGGDTNDDPDDLGTSAENFDTDADQYQPEHLSLEKDLQVALRRNLGQIEDGLSVIDNGVERSIPSGRVDILAQDAQGTPVVIELNAVTARREVLGQIAAYMADIQDETGQRPRGILIAPDFDPKLVSGARMIDGLTLKRYAFTFSFSDL